MIHQNNGDNKAGFLYICVTAHTSTAGDFDTSNEPGQSNFWTTYWDRINGHRYRGAYSTYNGQLYAQSHAGDFMEHNGIVYHCHTTGFANSDNEPGVGSTWTDVWEEFALTGQSSENGTFTPAFSGASWITGPTYTIQDGFYVKTADLVTITFRIAVTEMVPGGGFGTNLPQIVLPFNPGSPANRVFYGTADFWYNLDTPGSEVYEQLTAVLTPNFPNLRFRTNLIGQSAPYDTPWDNGVTYANVDCDKFDSYNSFRMECQIVYSTGS